MSKFFGVYYGDRINIEGNPSDRLRAEDMSARMRKQGHASDNDLPVVASGPQLLAVADIHTSTEGLDVFLDGRLRFDRDATHGHTDPARMVAELMAAYRQKGEHVFAHCYGNFTAVIVDHHAGRVLLGVDRLGTRSVNFAMGKDGALIFGTGLRAVAQHPAVAAQISRQAVFDFIHLHMVPSPDTIYTGVQKLPRGSYALFANGDVKIERYWRPDFADTTDAAPEQLHEELHDQLHNAVARCEPDDRTGAFLSGGLDSSTIVGKYSALKGVRANTFSVGFDADGYDELSYARMAVDRFGTRQHEISLTAEHILEAIPLIAAFYDEPFGNSSAVPTYFCARLAHSEGMQRLLAGDGGDELFAGNPHYTRQKVFELYWLLPEVVRRTVFEGVLAKICPEESIFPFGKIRSYIDQASIPLPQRLYSWNYLFRHPSQTIFSADFISGIDDTHPGAVMSGVYQESEGAETIDRLLYFDWKYVLGDNDLRKVGEMCELGGIEVSYPMLDDALVDFALRVPASLKIRGQELRYFYKQAMQGFLPDAIINKPKHGFGLPFGVWLKSSVALQDYVTALFDSLKSRNIFNPEFLTQLLLGHRDGEPGYYGSVIWDVLMLEAWLQAHEENV